MITRESCGVLRRRRTLAVLAEDVTWLLLMLVLYWSRQPLLKKRRDPQLPRMRLV